MQEASANSCSWLVSLRVNTSFASAHEDGLVVGGVADAAGFTTLDACRDVRAAHRLAHLQARQVQLGKFAGGVVRVALAQAHLQQAAIAATKRRPVNHDARGASDLQGR